jgi:hypothetical protein
MFACTDNQVMAKLSGRQYDWGERDILAAADIPLVVTSNQLHSIRIRTGKRAVQCACGALVCGAATCNMF